MFDEPALSRPTRGAALAAVAAEDLSVYAVEELETRVAALTAEIERTRAALAGKSQSRAAADAVFGAKG